MRRMVMMLGVAALMVALTATAALAATIYCPNASQGQCFGTAVGDALYGSAGVDRMYGYGGADLMYGYGSGDYMYGGNESGWGDKILGGGGNDDVRGQGGDDDVRGQAGNDQVYGGAGNDLVVGGPGRDYLSGGTGGDQINAQDGYQDTINCNNEYDRVYYDRGLDILQECPSAGRGENLVTEQPPKDLFKHTGKVLIEHKGKELLLPEKALKGHLGHGDEILNPTGRSSVEQGRR